MSTGLIFHNDLDGLYSALAIVKSGQFEIDKVFPVDYGKPHEGIKEQCDEFIIVDYADNITEEKTVLWLDHHLHEEELPEAAVIKEAPSCLRLLLDSGISVPGLDEDIVAAVDIVDSASYSFDDSYSPVDVLFPDLETTLGKMVMLNQLLMKNRKTNVSVELLIEDTFDPNTLLYRLDNLKGTKIHRKDYYESKEKLVGKLMDDDSGNYIKYFDNIPVLMTNNFEKDDWRGYDRNVFYFIARKYPYAITTFDFSNNFNFQVSRNIFYENEIPKDLDYIFREEEELRGHKNILNFTFDNKEEGLEKLDYVITELSKNT